MVGFGDQLVREFRLQSRQLFVQSYRDALEGLAGASPFDTGKLKAGNQIVGAPVLTGDELRVTIINQTKSRKGFDYPEFLNKKKRIEPTKAQYLHFQVGGQWVRSSGFDNRHYLWWDEYWGLANPPDTWARIMLRNQERFFG